MEFTEETCRGGRSLITAVNHRDGGAIYLDPAEFEPSHRHHAATMAELADGGFVATASAMTNASPSPVEQPGAGLVWRGADRLVRVAVQLISPSPAPLRLSTS